MIRKPPKGKSLAELNPKLAKECHPTKNGDFTPYDFSEFSHKKVWWKCKEGEDHEWEASISHRSNGRGCPICNGNKVVGSNCLATLNPDLAKEWHPSKNLNLTPLNVSSSSNKAVWWKCDKGYDHVWEAKISNRNNGRGCPICSNRKVVLSNCLATLNPELAKEWLAIKNKDLTPFDVTTGNNKKVW